MIVDDQALVLDILSKGLSRDPMIHIVGIATDGQVALNQLERLKPDVIILDMEMPRMNGLQFLDAMIPRYAIPTIVLSALTHKDSQLTQQVFELGAFDFLAKPQGGARELPKLIIQLLTKIRIAATHEVSRPVFRKPAVTADEAQAPETKTAGTQTAAGSLIARLHLSMPSSEAERKAKTDQMIIGMGAYEISNSPGKVLKIYALGSCVGVALFCPSKSMVAMAHVVLPASSSDPNKAHSMPGYFADTAINKMLDRMVAMGCPKGRIFAKIAGGAKTAAKVGDCFEIGQRNAAAAKETLAQLGIRVLGEDTGGTFSRTVYVAVGDSNYYLIHPEKGKWII